MRQLPLTIFLLTTLLLIAACSAEKDTSAGTPKLQDAGTEGDDDSGATLDTEAADGGTPNKGTSDAAAPDPGTSDAAAPDAGSAGPACHPTNPAKGPCPAEQHCVWNDTGLACVADGAHLSGEDCSDNKGCKIGVCVKNSAGESKCAPHCLSNLDCASGICNNLQDSKGKVCEMGSAPQTQCNPLKQNCKKAGEGCFGTPDGFVCKLAGKAMDGQPCPDDASCVPGLLCTGKGSSTGICRKICNLVKGGEPSCDVGVKCTPYLGGNFVGYCE